MISPLQLEQHQLLEVDFRIHGSYIPPEEEGPHNLIMQARGETLEVAGEEASPYLRINVVTHYTLFGEEEDPQGGHLVLILEVNRGDEDEGVTPYSLRLVLAGLFRAYSLPSGEEREGALRVVRANGAGLLYGIARQLAKSLTLQSGRPGLMLPSLSFKEVVEHESKVEESEKGVEPKATEAE